MFLEYHVYEEDINISSNWEVFLEVLDGKDLISLKKKQQQQKKTYNGTYKSEDVVEILMLLGT